MQPPSRPGTVLAPLEPGDPPLVGGYRVLARLGEGGQGRVYLATTQSGRLLAVRVAEPEAAEDAAFRRRLKREIAAAQRVRGPYLAAVVDGHAEGSSPWVAGEYPPGPSLRRAVEESGPLPVAAVRVLMGSVAQALQAVHDSGIAHGDLDASKVFLTEEGPRVTGFGSLKHDDPDPAGRPEELRGPIGRCLVIALGIGGGAFGLLVLVLLTVFLL